MIVFKSDDREFNQKSSGRIKRLETRRLIAGLARIKRQPR